jgi:hypothetical protein
VGEQGGAGGEQVEIRYLQTVLFALVFPIYAFSGAGEAIAKEKSYQDMSKCEKRCVDLMWSCVAYVHGRNEGYKAEWTCIYKEGEECKQKCNKEKPD